MKKLLSLLSILTISGTAVPTTIAASPYQKEKNIKNSYINYQQINNLRKLNRVKREKQSFSYALNKSIITSDSEVSFPGTILNNKIYFGTDSGKVYEYSLQTLKVAKNVINSDERFTTSGVILNNKLYFGSNNGKVYEYDPEKNQKWTIDTTEKNYVIIFGAILNNKLYFSTRKSIYEYDPDPEKGRKPQVILSNFDGDLNMNFVILNNKLYFGSNNGKVYEYDPEKRGEPQVIITTGNNDAPVYGIELNNKLYFGSHLNLYEYDPTRREYKTVIKNINEVISFLITLNNKLYVGTYGRNNIHEYDQINKTAKILDGKFGAKKPVTFNNKIYFESSENYNKIYEYDPATGKHNIIITAESDICTFGVILNNRLYFGTKNGKIYEYDLLIKKQKIVVDVKNKINNYMTVLDNRLYFDSNNKIYEFWPIESIIEHVDSVNYSDIDVDQILISWKSTYEDWKELIKYKKDKFLEKMNEDEKKIFFRESILQFKDRISDYIHRIKTLDNSRNIDEIKLSLDDLINENSCTVNNFFDKIKDKTISGAQSGLASGIIFGIISGNPSTVPIEISKSALKNMMFSAINCLTS